MLYFTTAGNKESRMSRFRSRLLLVFLLTFAWGLVGCEEAQVFEPIERLEDVLVDFEQMEIPGLARFEVVAPVTADMRHPHIEARWTNLEAEIEVDVYIQRLSDYDAELPPSAIDQDKILWTSVSSEGALFGEGRPTSIAVHPADPARDTWILFFYNPNDPSPANIAKLSATVKLTFFQ
ncbi:MAG: hypothetical protein ACE5G2_06920 [Candidatus Krumholzibacteriia bacterium]